MNIDNITLVYFLNTDISASLLLDYIKNDLSRNSALDLWCVHGMSGVFGASLHAFAFIFIKLLAIDLITPVRVSEDEEHPESLRSMPDEIVYSLGLF